MGVNKYLKKEIGSEFDVSIDFLLDIFQSKKLSPNKIFCKNVTDIAYLSNGRTAIKFILLHVLERGRINKCWLPSYLCETIIQPFRELKLDYEFYNLEENLQIDIDYLSKRLEKNDLLFASNYFNLSHDNIVIEFLKKLKNNNIVVIDDLTHSFLNNNVFSFKISDYSIISLRKWLGISDGGIAISNDALFDKKLIITKPFNDFVRLRLRYALLKNFYLHEIINKEDSFRKMHDKAEEIANLTIRLHEMSNISKTILNTVNFSKIIYKRRMNFKYLLSSFEDLDKIKILSNNLEEGICPIGFPIITTKRDILRDYLASNNIYCPIHWLLPKEIPKKFDYSYFLSQNIITIPCDQRYSIEDMEIIIRSVKRFYKKINS